VCKAIQLLGTKTVVFSGGEPLAHGRLGDILHYASGDCSLRIGMITSGVSQDAKSNAHEPVSDELARTIAASCDWVQLSIDSFNPQTYRDIRGAEVKIPKESIEKLSREMGSSGSEKRLEICYTIQKKNVDRLEEDLESMNALLGTESNVTVRFKIAHGPENGRDRFVPDAEQLERISGTLKEAMGLSHASRFNIPYLIDSIGDRQKIRDVSDGKPVESRMWHNYRQKNYLCYIMRLFCFINANGDVYPCCFLFDDNHAESRIRDRYKIGTLRFLAEVTEQNNPLAQLWYENSIWDVHRRSPLPVDSEACSYCTRFFYQNELLNEFVCLLKKYDRYGLADRFERDVAGGPQKEAYWL
jgi:MoaA/NifB/PqqE/SkfB family radical SAM enzyme